MAKRKTQEEIIAAFKAAHGERYDYSQVIYVNAHTKVNIICPVHGVMPQNPDTHAKGYGCKKCGRGIAADKARSNTAKFVEKAREIHLNTYDYSKVSYVNAKTEVIIFCHKHCEFPCTPDRHFSKKKGCPTCEKEQKKESSRARQEAEFLINAKKKYGELYDYSSVYFIHRNKPVIIGCTIHGRVSQSPRSHLTSLGCQQCHAKNNPVSIDRFIEQSKALHSVDYDYSRVSYRILSDEVEIICPEHGSFTQVAEFHLRGATGCGRCASEKISKSKTKDLEVFVQSARENFGAKYDYSKAIYKGFKKPLIIICPIHGNQQQSPYRHLQSDYGCTSCAREHVARTQQLTLDVFIARATTIHQSRYEYTHVSFNNLRDKVIIDCPEHGFFHQTASKHLEGSGCSACASWGFDYIKPATLYYLHVKNVDLFKIGITNRKVEERFLSNELENLEFIKTWYFSTGRAAHNLEQEVIAQHKRYRYKGKPVLSSGNTELFNADILDGIELLIKSAERLERFLD